MTDATRSERNRRYRAKRKAEGQSVKGGGHSTRSKSSRWKPFHAIDGEGMTDPSDPDRHILYLLRAGEHELYNGGEELRTDDILIWLSELPYKSLIGYSFGYDMTMILRDLAYVEDSEGRNVAKRLANRDGYTSKEALRGIRIEHLDLYVSWIDGKFLSVYSPRRKSTVRISDAFGLFQSSFVNALKAWDVCTPEELEYIGEYKDKRGTFDDTPEEHEYNRLECVYLERLMIKVRLACAAAGMMPKRWEGAGKLAEAMYAAHDVPKKGALDIPSGIADKADLAYLGGWFEAFWTGRITQPVYAYDINSAYPSAMLDLPCLLPDHGVWIDSDMTGHLCLEDFSLCSVSWTPISDDAHVFIGPLPVRTKSGTITHPLASFPGARDWYWNSEVQAAIECGLFSITVHRTLHYEQLCECEPMAWVADAYDERQKLAASGSVDAAVIIKLAINSLYGKSAQRKGAAPYRNLVWAGIITSRCRAQIYRAVNTTDQRNIVMIATDALFSLEPLPLDCPTKKILGKWEPTEYPEGIFIAQPGIYWANGATRAKKTKSRGISARIISEFIPVIEDAWYAHNMRPVVVIPTQFIGLKLAMARNAPDTAGNWNDDVQMTLTLIPKTKRRGPLDSIHDFGTDTTHAVMWAPILEADAPMVRGSDSLIDPDERDAEQDLGTPVEV